MIRLFHASGCIGWQRQRRHAISKSICELFRFELQALHRETFEPLGFQMLSTIFIKNFAAFSNWIRIAAIVSERIVT
jgi:hypothetical protein